MKVITLLSIILLFTPMLASATNMSPVHYRSYSSDYQLLKKCYRNHYGYRKCVYTRVYKPNYQHYRYGPGISLGYNSFGKSFIRLFFYSEKYIGSHHDNKYRHKHHRDKDRIRKHDRNKWSQQFRTRRH